ncbi:conserved hypothetical protein [Ricinus communis]|uniref:Uncharacterized protein n=1 Tax=Ricinus communis TaxID=3988 RepID=B9RPU1_RICCO|nr:conserved hypothetical protein [Ricinus communis]
MPSFKEKHANEVAISVNDGNMGRQEINGSNKGKNICGMDKEGQCMQDEEMEKDQGSEDYGIMVISNKRL